MTKITGKKSLKCHAKRVTNIIKRDKAHWKKTLKIIILFEGRFLKLTLNLYERTVGRFDKTAQIAQQMNLIKPCKFKEKCMKNIHKETKDD